MENMRRKAAVFLTALILSLSMAVMPAVSSPEPVEAATWSTCNYVTQYRSYYYSNGKRYMQEVSRCTKHGDYVRRTYVFRNGTWYYC